MTCCPYLSRGLFGMALAGVAMACWSFWDAPEGTAVGSPPAQRVVQTASAQAASDDPSETAESGNPFARQTIDLGMIVSDIEQSEKFYTQAIGFQRIGGFSVPPELAGGSGLTDSKPFDVRVLALGTDETATKLKLIEMPEGQPASVKNSFIDSSKGYRYTTVVVKDINAAMKRLKEAGVQPLAKGPVLIPESIAKGVYLAVVRDPDGNFVELVGPKK